MFCSGYCPAGSAVFLQDDSVVMTVGCCDNAGNPVVKSAPMAAASFYMNNGFERKIVK